MNFFNLPIQNLMAIRQYQFWENNFNLNQRENNMSKTKINDEFVLLENTKLRYKVYGLSGTVDSVLVHLKYAGGKTTWFNAQPQEFITIPEPSLKDFFQKLDLR